jgi:hypothetical protein
MATLSPVATDFNLLQQLHVQLIVTEGGIEPLTEIDYWLHSITCIAFRHVETQ